MRQHVVPQATVPLGQTHRPFRHCWLFPHAVLQFPQCAEVSIRVQTPLQQSSFGPHAVPQLPQLALFMGTHWRLQHREPGGQALPQPPQFGEAVRSVQVPEQHPCPGAHLVRQVPQLFSLVRSAHAP